MSGGASIPQTGPREWGQGTERVCGRSRLWWGELGLMSRMTQQTLCHWGISDGKRGRTRGMA